MVTKINNIYEKVSKKHNLQLDLVKSVGDCVFDELLDKLSKFEDLGYDLPKLGTFNLRFKRFENYYLNFVKKLENKDPLAIEKLENNKELFELNTEIYKKIQNFRQVKSEKRKLRYETTGNTSSESKP